MKLKRILVAKPGLDGHDRGVKVMANVFRDSGMEVIYTGLHQTPEQIVAAALQEDVDVIGLSILSGAHLGLTGRVMSGLKEKGLEGMVVLVGGTIPEEDIPKLKEMGVAAVFPTGTPLDSPVEFIREHFKGKD